MTLATDATPATEDPGARPGRRGWAGWALSVLVAVVVAMAALVYIWWRGNSVDYQHSQRATATYAMADKLTIQVNGGDVRLRAGLDQTVVETLQEWNGKTVPSAESGYADGGTLTLTSGCRPEDCRVVFTVYVPLDTEVAITSTTGDLTLADVTGKVSVSLDSGDVTLENTRMSDLTVSVHDGDVHGSMASVPARLSVNVGQGDVDIDLPAATYTVTASASGDSSISVEQAAGAPNQVNVTVGGGDLKLH
jgi:hypothetical protein